MTLEELIEAARAHKMTDAERKEQVRSFAYGNVKLHNPQITREDIDRAADKLAMGSRDEQPSEPPVILGIV